MGFGGISPFQLIIILLIVLLLFGGKRLRGLGSDLGSAIKGFRKSMDDQNTDSTANPKPVEKSLDSNEPSNSVSHSNTQSDKDAVNPAPKKED